jgi:NAD(P)-dependent dehydrogenase (short-subunit alcohol dehydrogenase family)
VGELEGQIVLITGGGSGLGRGLVDAFVEQGAKVGVLELSDTKAEQLRDDVSDGTVHVVTGDVRDPVANARAVDEVVDRYGRLDAFIQCAGITDWTPALTLLPEESLPDAFTEIMGVNVLGAILGARAALAALRKTEGSMIFTLSTSGFFPGGQGGLYTLSKHALVGLVRQLAYELAPTVRVNAVIPGPVKESRIAGPAVLGQDKLYPEAAFPDIDAMITKATPRHIYPAAKDYAPIYLLLADRERARLATGSLISWDVGISLVGHGTDVMEALQSGAFG